jgi:hypothetical protein
MNLMRLSSMKAAHVAVSWDPRTGNPGISLVFREMWDTTKLGFASLTGNKTKGEDQWYPASTRSGYIGDDTGRTGNSN